MSGLLPLVGGGFLLILGGVAAIRSAGGRTAERRQLEGRLKELQVLDNTHIAGAAGPGLTQDLPDWLNVMFARADIVPRLDPILLLLVIFAGVAGIFLLLFGWIAATAIALLQLAGSFLTIRMIANRRIARFVDDLPFFLDTARQMLTTGNSVQQALARATENANPHLQRYLTPMIRRMQNGAAVGDSATWLAERLDVLELHMFATAIQTNIRYGGRLSVVLANLISVLRDRSRVIRELKAATAETRMSAIILGAMPLLAGVFIMFSSPGYVRFFFDTTQGHHLILFAIAFQFVGILLMRRLMRLDY